MEELDLYSWRRTRARRPVDWSKIGIRVARTLDLALYVATMLFAVSLALTVLAQNPSV